MNPKVVTILSFAAGLAFSALAAWKGLTVAGAVFGALALVLHALALLNAALKILPAKDEAYIDALESALKEHAPVMAQKVIRQ